MSRSLSREEIAARKVFSTFNWAKMDTLMSETSSAEVRRDRGELITCIAALNRKQNLNAEELMAGEYAEGLVAKWANVLERRGAGDAPGAFQPMIASELTREAEGRETLRRNSDMNTWRDRKTGREYRSLGPGDRFAQQPAGYQLGDLVRGMLFGAKSEPEMLALSEATIGSGAALVPTRLAAEIIDNLRAKAIAFKVGCRMIPMDVPTLSLAKIVTDPKPKWRSELDNVATASVSFDRINLVAKSCAWLVRASRELCLDSINFNSMLTELFVRVGATELDRVVFAGGGSSSPGEEPLGILSISGLAERDLAGAALTNYDKILDTIGDILDANGGFPDAWASAPSIEISLAKLKQSTTLAPMPEPPLLASRVTNRETTTALSDLGGSPATDNSMVFGGFDSVLVGMREEINIRPLVELFAATGEIGFIAHLRADVAVARPKQMGRLIRVKTT